MKQKKNSIFQGGKVPGENQDQNDLKINREELEYLTLNLNALEYERVLEQRTVVSIAAETFQTEGHNAKAIR